MKVRAQLRDAHAEVLREMEKATAGNAAVASLQQLQFIEHELRKMMSRIDQNDLPSKGERSIGLWQIILDNWPSKSALGGKIIAAELAYDKL